MMQQVQLELQGVHFHIDYVCVIVRKWKEKFMYVCVCVCGSMCVYVCVREAGLGVLTLLFVIFNFRHVYILKKEKEA